MNTEFIIVNRFDSGENILVNIDSIITIEDSEVVNKSTIYFKEINKFLEISQSVQEIVIGIVKARKAERETHDS